MCGENNRSWSQKKWTGYATLHQLLTGIFLSIKSKNKALLPVPVPIVERFTMANKLLLVPVPVPYRYSLSTSLIGNRKNQEGKYWYVKMAIVAIYIKNKNKTSGNSSKFLDLHFIASNYARAQLSGGIKSIYRSQV
jgi:hypothetical protein